jgi:hypothetical protein
MPLPTELISLKFVSGRGLVKVLELGGLGVIT